MLLKILEIDLCRRVGYAQHMNIDTALLPITLAGFTTTLTLIVAIGAQNTYVLKQGILGRWVTPIIIFCVLSDVLLIGLGVFGFGSLIHAAPWILEVFRYGGTAFLLWYGLNALWRSRKSEALIIDTADTGPQTLTKALLIAAAMTYLNPHAYLDTTILLGSLANNYGDPGRWYYYVGCCFGSLTWFLLLGYGSRFLRPIFAKPSAWRVLDIAIGLLMIYLAYTIFTMPSL